jgi:hypothetical protein
MGEYLDEGDGRGSWSKLVAAVNLLATCAAVGRTELQASSHSSP